MHRILIAEDNPRITEFLEAGLQAHGFTTLVARNGGETAQMASSADFDLLILDCRRRLRGALTPETGEQLYRNG